MSVYTYPDVQAAACDLLRNALDGRQEAYAAGAAVGTRVPGAGDPLPRVLVDKDADTLVYPIKARANVRVTCYHRSQQDAADLSQLCQGLLLSYPGGPAIEATRTLTGPIPGHDNEAGIDFATFSVAATVHGQAV
jgi:hypothetical protein